MAPKNKQKCLVIGGQFSGTFAARDLKKKFYVTVVDMKEYFEYTPGVLRAYVKPAHLDALTFTLQPVLERKMGVKFIWGEVKKLDEKDKTATIKPMFAEAEDLISWDFCIICAGCDFGPFQPRGESLWFPTCREDGREVSKWKHIDERYIEGRRRHILEEFHKLNDFNKNKEEVLVVGAGFIGVEWITEMEYFFPDLRLTIIDFLPRCLGPLPDSAAAYCSEYMNAAGIKEAYNTKYAPKEDQFWKDIGCTKGCVEYVCIGVKASNYFMPKEVLSDKGPGGGGWIHFNKYMQVTTKDSLGNQVWGDGTCFAVGDCNYGCIGNPKKWELPPIPKISYPGEEQALHAIVNMKKLADNRSAKLQETWWPWGAGMFATSLGPHDACFVLAANEQKGSGYMVNWWWPAAIQKEIIEQTKIDECADRWIGILIWHFVHHTPVNLFGRGPFFPSTH